MAKEQMHTIMSAAKELHKILSDEENLPEWVQKKITLAKEYIDSARDYMLTQHAERAEKEPVAEKAVSKKQQKFMGMVHAAQKGERPASKEVAKAAKGMGKKDAEDFAKTKHKGLPEKAKKEGTDKEDQHAERAGKKVTKDLEYDDGHKGKDDAKAEKAGKKVAKDIEYDDKKDKVKESNKGGYNFGGGVYESLDRKFRLALTEGMNVSVNMSTGQDGQPTKSINISADGEDADRLAELLKMAGLGGQDHTGSCSSCGTSPCGCAEQVDENQPDWPTNTETSDDALQYSGGLNKPKSTGQSTTPVLASQLRRQVSMEEGVTLERTLFNTWKNYKAQ
jgi:phage anti-repressor protein